MFQAKAIKQQFKPNEAKTAFFQPKLAINQPNDAYEQEADAVADHVMHRPLSFNDGNFFKPSPKNIQQKTGKDNLNKTAIIQRQPGGNHQTETTETRVQSWLNTHQFAPPEQQPSDGERHLLLNGEEITFSEAVTQAANTLHLSAEAVRPIISAELARPVPLSGRSSAWVGPGNRVPGLPILPQTAEDHLRIAKALELNQIDDWLTTHNFSKLHNPNPSRAMLDGRSYTIDEIVNRAITFLGPNPSLTRREVLGHIRQRYAAAATAGGNQWSLQAGLGVTSHNYTTPAGPSDPLREWVFQVTGAYTRQFHRSDESGFEFQVPVQVQYSFTTGQWSILGGVQGTYAINLPNNFSAGVFVQLLGGTALTNPLQPQIQPAAGAQIAWQPRDWLNLGIQGSGSYTGAFRGPSSVDVGGVFLITLVH